MGWVLRTKDLLEKHEHIGCPSCISDSSQMSDL